jgi:hypothetical protein
MKKMCCRKLKDYIRLEKSNFLSLKSGIVLLDCGNTRVTVKAIKRLIYAIGPSAKNIKLPSGPPNKLVKSPLIVPIVYCPFCGKKQ